MPYYIATSLDGCTYTLRQDNGTPLELTKDEAIAEYQALVRNSNIKVMILRGFAVEAEVPAQLTRYEQLAAEIAADLKNGKKSAATVARFSRLMATGERASGEPNPTDFGHSGLPADW